MSPRASLSSHLPEKSRADELARPRLPHLRPSSASRADNWKLAILVGLVVSVLAIAALPASASFWVVGAMAALVAAAFVVNAYRRNYYGGLLVAPAIAVLFVMNIFPLLWSLGLSFFAYQSNQQSIRFVGLNNYIKVADQRPGRRGQLGRAGQHRDVRGLHRGGADGRGLPAGHALRQAVPAAQISAHPGADADDALGRRLGRVLHLLLRPDLRHPQLCHRATSPASQFILMDNKVGAVAGIVFADAWMWSPFVMLLVLAGLVSVPKYLYEAAAIDRVSKWRQFWTITFPYIRGLLMLALLFRTIEAFKLADLVILLTKGGNDTMTISYHLIRIANEQNKTCEGAAISYLMLFMVIVLTNLYLYLANRRSQGA